MVIRAVNLFSRQQPDIRKLALEQQPSIKEMFSVRNVHVIDSFDGMDSLLRQCRAMPDKIDLQEHLTEVLGHSDFAIQSDYDADYNGKFGLLRFAVKTNDNDNLIPGMLFWNKRKNELFLPYKVKSLEAVEHAFRAFLFNQELSISETHRDNIKFKTSGKDKYTLRCQVVPPMDSEGTKPQPYSMVIKVNPDTGLFSLESAGFTSWGASLSRLLGSL